MSKTYSYLKVLSDYLMQFFVSHVVCPFFKEVNYLYKVCLTSVMSTTMKQCPGTLDSFLIRSKKVKEKSKLDSSLEDFVVEEKCVKNNSAKRRPKISKQPTKHMKTVSGSTSVYSTFMSKRSEKLGKNCDVMQSNLNTDPVVVSFDDFLSDSVNVTSKQDKIKDCSAAKSTSTKNSTQSSFTRKVAKKQISSENYSKNTNPKRKQEKHKSCEDVSKKRCTMSDNDVIIIEDTATFSKVSERVPNDTSEVSKSRKNKLFDGDIIEVKVIKSPAKKSTRSISLASEDSNLKGVANSDSTACEYCLKNIVSLLYKFCGAFRLLAKCVIEVCGNILT